jgi:hypothetical protein
VTLCRDLGGNIRFSGQASTVLCFENNPLVRKASSHAAFLNEVTYPRARYCRRWKSPDAAGCWWWTAARPSGVPCWETT